MPNYNTIFIELPPPSVADKMKDLKTKAGPVLTFLSNPFMGGSDIKKIREKFRKEKLERRIAEGREDEPLSSDDEDFTED